ncbi:MAG: S8 family serine peptidase, partial [Planctomycetota bacterium]
TTAFRAEAGRLYDVVVRLQAGHAPWTLALELTDPAPSPAKATPIRSAPAAKASPILAATALPGPTGPCAPDHVLVRLRSDTRAEALAERFGLRPGRTLGSGSRRFWLPEPLRKRVRSQMLALCKRLADDDAVAWAEPDWYVKPLGLPDDPELARQWNLRAFGAPAAWEVTRGEASVVVGIVDSGIIDHPDLVGQVAPGGYDFISDPAIAGDGNGRDPDPTDTGAQEDPSGLSWWHGTHVAGVVAGRADDGQGLAGVAPGCRVMPLRAVGRTGGLVSDVADAILYAAGLLTTEDGRRLSAPLPIVNLSFGLSIDSSDLRSACQQASNVGVLLVGASGNDGQQVLFPARYPTVLAVAAVDAMLNTMGYSSFGPEVDLAAPGGDATSDLGGTGWPDAIPSTLRDETVFPARPSLGYLEGTSQAAPHVAAVAGLLLSVDPTLSAHDLKVLLTGSAMDRGVPGKDDAYGWGVVQAPAAMALLLEEMGTPWTAPPSLVLPVPSVLFPGFDILHAVAVMNGGGGRLEFGDPTTATDEGGAWLSAELDPGKNGNRTNVKAVLVRVDRTELPAAPGAYSGSVLLRDTANATLGSIRVVAYVTRRLAAGQDLSVRAFEGAGSAIRARGLAKAAFGYRYWFPLLDAGSYRIEAGQDLDGDGFFCEKGDACGWYGGPTEADAQVVTIDRRETAFAIDVFLQRRP